MSEVAHPKHLLPGGICFKFSAAKPVTRKEIQEFLQRIVDEYFEKSPLARRLWHDRAEGIISDEEWVDHTLAGIQAHANDRLKETD